MLTTLFRKRNRPLATLLCAAVMAASGATAAARNHLETIHPASHTAHGTPRTAVRARKKPHPARFSMMGPKKTAHGKMIDYHNGLSDIKAYWVTPKGHGPWPAIIVVQDIFGLTPWLKQQAHVIASHGYVVLAPNLYSRENVPNGCATPRQAVRCYRKLSDSDAVNDLLAGITYVRHSPSVEGRRIGVVGYDLGGIYSIMLASSSLRIKAAVNFYGQLMYGHTSDRRPVSAVEAVSNLHAPLLSFYGDRDPQNPPPVLKLFRHHLAFNSNNAYHRVVIYKNVGHGFLVAGRQGYNAADARNAMEQTFAFLKRVLKAPRHRRHRRHHRHHRHHHSS